MRYEIEGRTDKVAEGIDIIFEDFDSSTLWLCLQKYTQTPEGKQYNPNDKAIIERIKVSKNDIKRLAKSL